MRESSCLISIGIPAFNCERTLALAERPILRQTYGNCGLLLMEDGLADKTLEATREFSHLRILVHSDFEHTGLVARLNEAVARSRGEYFARTDGDDVAFPERMERQIEYLTSHPEDVLVGGGMVQRKWHCGGLASRAANTRRNL